MVDTGVAALGGQRRGEHEARELWIDDAPLRLGPIADVGPAETRCPSAGLGITHIHDHEADESLPEQFRVARVARPRPPTELSVSLAVEPARVRRDAPRKL